MDQTSKAVTTGVIVNRIITVANLALTFALFISGSGGSLTRTVVFMAWLALGETVEPNMLLGIVFFLAASLVSLLPYMMRYKKHAL